MDDRTTRAGAGRAARMAEALCVHSALALLLAALYLLALALASAAGLSRNAAHIVAAAVVAVGLVPLRTWLWARADRLLRRGWENERDLLRDIGGALSRAHDPEALRALLADDLPARLGVTGAALWMLEPPDDRAFVALGAPRDAPGAVLLEHGDSVRRVAAADGPLDVPPGADWSRPLVARGAALAVPLRAGEQLVGIYGLGLAHGSRAVPAHIREIVAILAPAIGGAIENARAYAKIARLDAQLRALDQLKSSFIESIGHELRTPLTTLHLSLELLAAQPGASPALVRIMRASLVQLHALVNRALAFGSGDEEETSQSLASELIELEPLVAAVAQEYLDIAEARRLRLFLRIEPRLAVWGVPQRLRRALREVLDNAVRFTADGAVTIAATYHDGLAVLSVADEGPGVPEDEREQVFAAFYRGRGVRALADTPGAGLGLTIAARDIAAQHGRIWLERSGPAGTEIRIALPAVALEDERVEIERVVGAS
jgi:signal transduction histidine kinase